MTEFSKTVYVGLDAHKDSIAVAYAPKDWGVFRPIMNTRIVPS